MSGDRICIKSCAGEEGESESAAIRPSRKKHEELLQHCSGADICGRLQVTLIKEPKSVVRQAEHASAFWFFWQQHWRSGVVFQI